ncbi:hypothetical protein [Modestobacter italicus]|uniref:hypothetical protein n=1 Tax=Modestobacter italicus (strain DSM 44449 / CECT 9708 / BC 501) TaxID=2732864 RepID=UPI001C94B4BB|nr:hypothetical protein [Modestobacter italicus]
MAESTTRPDGAHPSGSGTTARPPAPAHHRHDQPVAPVGGPGTEPAAAGPADGAPAPDVVPGRAAQPRTGGTRRARHRAARPPLPARARAGLLWPLAALVVVGLVAGRTLRGGPLPGDGALMAPAFLLGRGEGTLAALSPEGLGAAHAAVYATVTRAVERHATLAGAERELLLVVLLVSAVLLWRTARRIGVPDAACALSVLVLGAVPALAPLHAVATPAVFASAWSLLAAWLLAGVLTGDRAPGARPPVAAAVLAGVAVVLAVLLAPDVLLLLVAGAAAAGTLTGPVGRRAAAAGLGLLLLAGTRVLVGRWHSDAGDPARWGAERLDLWLLSAALVAVGLVAAWSLPAVRALGVALVAVTVVAVAPPLGRLSGLVLVLPLAALLLGAVATVAASRVARPVLARRPRALLAAGLAAAVVLAGAGAAATVALAGTPRRDLGAGAYAQLARWAGDQLRDDAVLVAGPRTAAELLHAGVDEARLARRGEVPVPASAPAPDEPALRVTTDRPAEGSAVLARFGDAADGPVLTVTTPRPTPPTEEQLAARRDLAAALLANPTIEVPADDAALLAAGRVDPRLLSLLAGLGARYGVGVGSLLPVPGEPAEAPVRQAVISSLGGTSLAGDDAAARAAEDRLRALLDAQRPPYAPSRVTEVEGGLLVGYPLVRDPDTLVSITGGR